MRPQAETNRIAALDGLRGIAILLVLMVHIYIQPSADWPSLLLNFVRTAGWLGVDLFFVLSGYLITNVLLEAKGKHGYLRGFFGRRSLRIWPLYYLTLAFAFIVGPHLAGLKMAGFVDIGWSWLVFMQNIPLARNAVAGTSFDMLWSIAVEEQVYLLMPFVILLVPASHLKVVFGLAFALALVARIWLVLTGAPTLAGYFLSPTRWDSFAIGGMLALVLPQASPARARRCAKVAMVTSGSVLVALAIIGFGFDPESIAMRTIGYTLNGVFFGGLLAYARTAPSDGAMAHPLLRLFGKYSYAIYLFHFPAWDAISPHVPTGTILGTRSIVQVIAWVAMAALCLGIGWLSWNLVERHALSLKRYFAREHQRSPWLADLPELRDGVDVAAPVQGSA